ncbi:putative hydrolase of the HAD superfamily [Lentzea atacamensis]|uniref:Hydrolase of the HAD superfamily n=1 Tax=Lentzea atacamensis TaxID=531938 RepID=A0ABX9DZ80_9PSEU|nr:HAD family hydrolase [Lentzea atacamensis]RAS59421.1 putative hydrolase of the HAD superfamily [Lentzea atacamensis]
MTGPTAALPLHGWVVSVDLWGTLITYGDRNAEAEWRLREFETVLTAFGHDVGPDRLREAVLAVRDDTRARQRDTGEQPPVRDQVMEMLTALNLGSLDPVHEQRLVDTLLIPHTHAVQRACPEVFPGALTALWELRQAGARLVLTSNTLATPASVSRLIMEERGLLSVFDDTVFSSDIGIAKPRREIFAAVASRSQVPLQRVVHVGNSPTTDIAGALNAGCRAVLLTHRDKRCDHDVPVITALDQLPAAILALCAAAPGAA